MILRSQYCYNGYYYFYGDKKFSTHNRAFRYGDAIFETIYVRYTECVALEEHIKRLHDGMRAMYMEIPDDFNYRFFRRKIIRLLNKNHHIKNARVRIEVFRNNGGLYTPTDDSVSFVIESEPLDLNSPFDNIHRLKLDVCPSVVNIYSSFSEFKTSSSLRFTIAGKWKTINKLDDCVILNEKGEVSETMCSNVFMVKDEKCYTPSLKCGCINGIMRNLVVNLLRENDIYIDDDARLSVKDLEEADEIFITNSISWIQVVNIFKSSRYYSALSKRIKKLFTEQYF